MANEITWRLEHERIGRLLLHYAMPAVIGTMVNALYNIVDRIFIGQGVGPLAMAGLTLTFPILLFLQAFGMLIGAGAATRVSIYLGRRENEMAEKVLGNAFTLTFIITLATVVPCMIWMKDLLLAFGGSEQTIPYAQDYLNIVVPGTLLTSLSFGFNAVMRASGYPKKAMFTMLIGAITNVILDPIFIFWLDMGIKGAAIATIISMLLCTLFVMNHFVQKDSIVRFHKGTFKLEKHVVWNILTIGVSPFAMQLAGSLVCDPELCTQTAWGRLGIGGKRHYHQCRNAFGDADYRDRAGNAADCRFQFRGKEIRACPGNATSGHHNLYHYHGSRLLL